MACLLDRLNQTRVMCHDPKSRDNGLGRLGAHCPHCSVIEARGNHPNPMLMFARFHLDGTRSWSSNGANSVILNV
jgi:hypothetical protein